ncbi:MAG: DEAD/DEAH box helicase [Desulfurococcaceae archaeon]
MKEGIWYTISEPRYTVHKEDIIRFLARDFGRDAQQIFNELLERGFLIPLSGSFETDDDELGYRSLHMDVLCRSSEIRTAYDTTSYLISTKLAFNFVKTPTQNDRRIPFNPQASLETDDPLYPAYSDLVKTIYQFFKGRADLALLFMRIAGQFVPYLDAYQALALSELLRSRKSAYVLVAPTGSGKTEIFLTYVLAWLMKQRYIHRRASRVLLIYPRKALTVDQANRIIKLLYISSNHNVTFNFAIRDGDTPRQIDLQREIARQAALVFRGTTCPICTDKLILKLQNGKFTVVCNSCKTSFDFIKATREQAAEADIIAVNPWSLEIRLMDSNQSDVNVRTMSEVELIVIDEAHEYKGLGGGLFNALLDIVRYVRRASQKGEADLRIILSSATIPQPDDFASKLTDVPKDQLQVISYNDVDKIHGENAISGRRLVLLGLFSMNPLFSWNTYCQLWLVLTTFLSYCFALRKEKYRSTPAIQSVLFVNNIRELKRVRSGFLNNLSLGEPKDHLSPELSATDPFCYWHYIPPQLRAEVRRKVERLELCSELENRLVLMLSELDVSERTRNISRLKSDENLVALSTSSLELGVDYGGVTFILNSGLENPISLLQRLGRGGRSIKTMRTVLGIILARATISEAFLLYDKAYSESLLNLEPSASFRLFVTQGNPQIEDRRKLVEAIASLALKGEHTYASRKRLNDINEIKEFLNNILVEIKEING